jgi:hypothetical protein
MSDTNVPVVSGQPDDIVRRPIGQLHNLPIKMRWEITRRHPYYLTFWERAQRYHRGDLVGAEQQLLGYIATLVLGGGIGVFGEPVSPATPAMEITGNNPSFLTGSVQPLTMRHLVSTILTGLPPADRAVVGSLLLNSGSAEYHAADNPPGQPPRALAELDQLAQTPSAALDSCPEAPLFYIHLGASGRSIVADMKDQVRRWQKKRGLTPSKVQTAKLPKYLEVWDLREGWTGSAYDRSQELKFSEIERRLKRGLSTVVSQYLSAFEMIVGHAFSPDLWVRVFGPVWFAPLFGDPVQVYSTPTRRRLSSPTRRPTPDTKVSKAAADSRMAGVVERETAIAGKSAEIDLLIDLRDLMARGWSDAEIAAELELADPKLVAYYRDRMEDLDQIRF